MTTATKVPEVFWPDTHAPFRGSLDRSDADFERIRELALLYYCYNTARAYAADLDDLYAHHSARRIRLEQMTETDFASYATDMLDRGYSRNTVRRRRTALNLYIRAVADMATCL